MAVAMQPGEAEDTQELAPGAVVRTDADADSVAEVLHRTGALTRLDRASEAVIDRAEVDGRPRVIVTLGPGRSWHKTGPADDDDPVMYEARCPAVLLTARAAVFTVACRADGSSDIVALQGNVVVRSIESGSIVLGDGQGVTVGPDGVLGEVGHAVEDDWAQVNRALDAPDDDGAQVEPVVTIIPPPAPLPRWVARSAGVLAVVAFAALLAGTFATAERGAKTVDGGGEEAVSVRSLGGPVSPLPAGAAAMIRAAQDRRVAPEPREVPERPRLTKVTPKVPTAVALFDSAPVPTTGAPTTTTSTAPATASATGTSCTRQGGSIVFSGRVRNTSTVASRFAVDTMFVSKSGDAFASKTATTGTVAPGQSASWSASVRAGSNSGSCEIAAVRPV